jgi:hypothetical protein
MSWNEKPSFRQERREARDVESRASSLLSEFEAASAAASAAAN